MKKAEKKEQITKMIAEFFNLKESAALIKMRNKIYTEIFRLPMSSNDKNTLEESMYLWNYNSDNYIKNIKSTSAKARVVSDFDSMIKTIDVSLLGN